MKTLSQFITERFITIFSADSKDDQLIYAQQVWNILNNSYKYIGGLSGCKTYNDFKQLFVDNKKDDFLWKLVRRGEIVTAVKIYKVTGKYRKSVAMGCVDTVQGKNDLNMIIKEDINIKERGVWAEVSGKALGKYINMGAIILPSSFTSEVFPDKKILDFKPDGYFYTREIKGEIHTKILIGYPPNGIIADKPDEELIRKIKELGKKYSN